MFYFFCITAFVSFLGLSLTFWQKRRWGIDESANLQILNWLIVGVVTPTAVIRSGLRQVYLYLLGGFGLALNLARQGFRELERRFASHRGRLSRGAVSFYLAEVKEYTDGLKRGEKN